MEASPTAAGIRVFGLHQLYRMFHNAVATKGRILIGHIQSKLSSKAVANATATASYEELKSKRAWDLAISPAKSLPMQAFMLYMSGGGVQIFSMGIVFMLLSSPFKNVASINTGAFCCHLLRCSVHV